MGSGQFEDDRILTWRVTAIDIWLEFWRWRVKEREDRQKQDGQRLSTEVEQLATSDEAVPFIYEMWWKFGLAQRAQIVYDTEKTLAPTFSEQADKNNKSHILGCLCVSRLLWCSSGDRILENRRESISTRFTEATGRSFILSREVNLNCSAVRDRAMLTGRKCSWRFL